MSFEHPFQTDPSEGYYIFRATWKLIKPEYLTALFVTLINLVAGVGVQLIPWVGSLAWAFVGVFLNAGIIQLAHKWHQKESADFQVLFFAFESKDVARRLVPLCIVNLVAAFIADRLGDTMGTFGALLGLLIVVSVMSVVWVATVQTTLEVVSWRDAFAKALSAIFLNWKTFFLSTLLMIGGLILSVLTLGLGFLVFFPIVMFSVYFWYRTMYLGESAKCSDPFSY